MSLIPSPFVNRSLEYKHIKAITTFQSIFRYKRAAVAHLNSDLETIYATLVSISNNISNNYSVQIISQDNYQRYMNQADGILTSLSKVPRPVTMAENTLTLRCTVAYLSYQVTELLKHCGASSCYDIFRCIAGKDWDLSVRPQHRRLLNLYNTMFVPIGVKINNSDHPELKVIKYSAFTVSLLLKVHGAEIIVPFYNRVLIIRGYFRDDPLNIARVGGTLEAKYKLLLDTARGKSNDACTVQRYMDQVSLRDFLCCDISTLVDMMTGDLNDLDTMSTKPTGHIIEDFLKATMKRQYTMITLLCLTDATHGHVKSIISTLYGNDRLTVLYKTLHWSIQNIFDKIAKTIDKGTEVGMDDCILPYETRIENLKASETVKRKAREKLKEIKLSKDGNEKATTYLDALLQIPFGIYRKERILRSLGDIRENIRTIETSLEEYGSSNTLLNSIRQKIHNNYDTENHIENMLQSLNEERASLTSVDVDTDFTHEFQMLWNNWNTFRMERKQYVEHVHNTLSGCIYGQTEAKRSIESLTAQWINGEMTGVVFGFQGYPGTGKTTLAKQGISRCLVDDNGSPRPFYFISLGGSSGGNNLEGHGYTYVGAQWGKLVDCLREAKVMNPVLYFDELDKVSETPKGDEIIRILTHLTDPEQNDKITDRYFGLDFDFSKAVIIFSYNDDKKIDRILMDRIYEVRFRQYNKKDKIVIARDYIIPRILKSVGYSQGNLLFSDDILGYIIENYTVEAGVRDMKDKLTEIVREINLRRIYDEATYTLPYNVSEATVDDILGQRHKIIITEIPKKSQVGWVNGLYATDIGTGGITVIQVFDTPSDQKYALELTGNLGDVMKESVRCAKTISWRIFNKEDRVRIDQEWRDNAVHVHFPAAGTSKDGPSAGAAITTAIISYFSKLAVRNYVAMTGEIDLYGNVRAIGGLQCKIEGAQRAGVKVVLIPRDNERDYLRIKGDYTVRVFVVDNISQIVRTCLIGAEDGTFNYQHDVCDSGTREILQYMDSIGDTSPPPVSVQYVPTDKISYV